jgi:peptidyl-prolyl cis-trans isomerase-like 2
LECAGFKEQRGTGMEKLPFNCCALSFTPFEDPVCTADGVVFDVANIVPYINKHHTSPVTGEPLDLDELISLKFHKNGEGEYECPVMKKVFNQVSVFHFVWHLLLSSNGTVLHADSNVTHKVCANK